MIFSHPEQRFLFRQKGFTMIEVMVAMAIFVIAILGCYRLQAMSSLSNSKADSVATAASWAQYVAENLLARKYTASYTDPLLRNRNGNSTDGSVDLETMNAKNSDGVRYVQADGSISATLRSALYTIYWNIVDNQPLYSIKRIHIIVVKNGGLNSGTLYEQDYYKSESL